MNSLTLHSKSGKDFRVSLSNDALFHFASNSVSMTHDMSRSDRQSAVSRLHQEIRLAKDRDFFLKSDEIYAIIKADEIYAISLEA